MRTYASCGNQSLDRSHPKRVSFFILLVQIPFLLCTGLLIFSFQHVIVLTHAARIFETYNWNFNGQSNEPQFWFSFFLQFALTDSLSFRKNASWGLYCWLRYFLFCNFTILVQIFWSSCTCIWQQRRAHSAPLMKEYWRNKEFLPQVLAPGLV